MLRERVGGVPLPDLGEEGPDGAPVGALTGISFFPCYIFSLISRVLVCWGCCNEVPKLSALNNGSVLSPSSGGCQPRIKASAGLVPSEGREEDGPLPLPRLLEVGWHSSVFLASAASP